MCSIVFFTMILYFELTANCSLIRSESSVWKVCVKKYGFFYEDEDDTSVHDNPEVIDLEFMQYAKNDISALLDQSEAVAIGREVPSMQLRQMSEACPDDRPCPAGAEAGDRRQRPLQPPRAGAAGREVAAVKWKKKENR